MRRTNTIAGEIKEVPAPADVLLLCRYPDHPFAEVAALKETYEFGGGILKSFDDVFAPCRPPVGDPTGRLLKKLRLLLTKFQIHDAAERDALCWMSRAMGDEKLADTQHALLLLADPSWD